MEYKPEDSAPAALSAALTNQVAVLDSDKRQTLAGILKQHYQNALADLLPKFPPDHRKEFERDFFRRFDPWPDWVLRIAAEVIHVRLPTIQKDTIEDTCRLFHFFLLVAKIDGSTKEQIPKGPELNPKIMGALTGHVVANILRFKARIEALKGLVPADRLDEISKEMSVEGFQKEMAPIIGDYFKQRPEGLIEFQRAFGDAEVNTFDRHGSPKETPLTGIYEKILSDWPEIECLSGPKALCEYMSPMLGKRDFEDKYERVKKICQRMRITFRPLVKGQ